MSEITLSLEHPSLGYGEIIARYDLSKIQEKAYQQGRADAIEELVGNTIESIEEIKCWYKEKQKEISDVQICIILDDLNALTNQLKECGNDN